MSQVDLDTAVGYVLKRATVALILLSSLVIMDLSIPLLIERIINQGIVKHNQTVVIQTSLFMIGLSILSTVIAVGNSILSVRGGESVARDLRDAGRLRLPVDLDKVHLRDMRAGGEHLKDQTETDRRQLVRVAHEE